MTLDTERRNNPRPAPPPPAFNLRLDKMIAPIMRRLQPPLRGTAMLWLLTITCGLWSVWNIEVRMNPLQQWMQALHNEMQLRTELDRLQSQWSPAIVADLDNRIAQARAAILPGYPALADWLHSKARDSEQLGIRLSYVLGNVELQQRADYLMIVPLELTFNLVPGQSVNGYQKLMQQLFALHDGRWALELRGVEVESGEAGAESMKTTLGVWIFADPANLASGADELASVHNGVSR
ncbi:MAG: hypothetical protein H6978_13355 [Gammaproteobacteria bacterium]|nr:hypothetical protein [Gammaproteobacteria bacterium]